MPYFSENDINEAKRRVSDMQKRASRLTDEKENENKNNIDKKDESKANHEEPDKASANEKDDSSLIILALIMLLSHEGADNMLILALLYLLF